jgi:hypothetical protein
MSRLPVNPQDLLAAIEAAVQERTAARNRLREAQEDADRHGMLLTDEQFLPLWNAWKRAQRKLELVRRAARKAGVSLPAVRRRHPATVCPLCGQHRRGVEGTM